MVALLRHPDQLAALRADPELWPGAVEELLRYLTVPIGMRRVATEDVEIGGVRTGRGRRRGGAPGRQPGPARLRRPRRPGRRPRRPAHLAFGHGLHQCLGQSLARAELQIGLPTLFRRLPDLRLTSLAEVSAHEGRAVHGVRTLPVTW